MSVSNSSSNGYSLFSATANMLLSVLGAGQLTLPYAFRELGWIAGLSFLLVFAFLGIHSLHCLSVHSRKKECLTSQGCSSYTELAVETFGPGIKKLCDALIAIYAWGGALSFMVILKAELNFLDAQAIGKAKTGAAWPDWLLLVLVSAFIIFPLCSRESPGGLRRVSPFGCAAAIFITFVVLACAPWSSSSRCEGHTKGEMQLWPRSFLSAAAALPLLSFALNSSWAFLPILAGLRHREQCNAMIWLSMTLIAVDYSMLAFAGYSTFCDATEPNILTSLGRLTSSDIEQWKLVVIVLAKAALAIQLTLALPLRFMVARSAICSSFSSWQRRWLLSAVLVASAAAIASTPIPLATTIGITSSVCASMIIYILPALIDLSVKSPGVMRHLLSLMSLPVGLFVLLAGTAANVFGASAGA